MFKKKLHKSQLWDMGSWELHGNILDIEFDKSKNQKALPIPSQDEEILEGCFPKVQISHRIWDRLAGDS